MSQFNPNNQFMNPQFNSNNQFPINQQAYTIDSSSNIGRNLIIVLIFLLLGAIIIGSMHFHLYSKINQEIADFKTWDESNTKSK
jgi:hypothetical protein